MGILLLREEKIDRCVQYEHGSENDGCNMEGFFCSPFFKFPEIIGSRRYREAIAFSLDKDEENQKSTDYYLDNEEYFKHMEV